MFIPHQDADIALGGFTETFPRRETMDFGFTIIENYLSLIYSRRAVKYIIRFGEKDIFFA